MMFRVPFVIPLNVSVTNPPPIIPPPIMPPPVPPPVPPIVITPPLIWNVNCVEETGPVLPIIWENVSFPPASTTECPYVQSRKPELPEDTECITQSPVMSAVEAVVARIMTHISGLAPLVSVATIIDLSTDMTPWNEGSSPSVMIPFASMEKAKFPPPPTPAFVVTEVMLALPDMNCMVP